MMKLTLSGLLACSLVLPFAAQGKEYKFNLLSDLGRPFDGQGPEAGVVKDGAGNLYGTTVQGGADSYGTVFLLTPSGTLTDLHDFDGGNDGGFPLGDLVFDAAGNLFGTTSGYYTGTGTVFEIAADGTYSVLHDFAGGSDGLYPEAGLLLDTSGNLYGTTEDGGSADVGTVFKLAPDGTETILYQFTGGTDGAYPVSRLIADTKGNLYGTAAGAGAHQNCGTVFRLAPDNAFTTLYSFGKNRSDGCHPEAGVVADATGNLYGTTYHGVGLKIAGTVFKLAPSGNETTLYAFQDKGKNGASPVAALTMDADGNLYGTTSGGGDRRGYVYGVVFEITAGGAFSLLYKFDDLNIDGGAPEADLYLDQSGNLIGTAASGGPYGGTIFELTKK